MIPADPYDTSRGVGEEIGDIFARWRSWSDAAAAALPHTANLAYGPTPDEVLDLFVPARGAPLVVWFHGGYWRRLHKDDNLFVARGLAPHGVGCAVVNYGLAPALTLEAITAQARRALAWLRADAAGYGADAARITVAGHSAGGHLAAMCAVDAPVRGVVTISGLHDLRPLVHAFVNAWLALDDARAAALSPALLAPAAGVPVYATAGTLESDDFRAQGRDFAAAWRRLGCEASYEDAVGDHHFSIADRLHDPADPLTLRLAATARA